MVLEKTLASPLDCKEIKPVIPKGNQPWILIGRTDAEAEAPVLWPPDAKGRLTGSLMLGKIEDRRRSEQQSMRWLDGITNSMDICYCSVAQLHPSLWDPMVPDFLVHGIFQAIILEWVAISFSRGSFQPRDQKQVSCIAGKLLTNWATRET